ncbi:Adenine nucleotide transporter BT1, chloroplastic/amyloplastic/mitochondrial [Linum grandiflorum]
MGQEEIKTAEFVGLVVGPAMVKLVVYPVAGSIVVALGETLDGMPPGQMFLMSGALSALTASVILLPFKTSTNYKEYIATFRDMWRDGGFRSLFLKVKPGVGWMTLGIHIYELIRIISDFDTNDQVVHTRPRAMVDLTRAVVASVAPEVLRYLHSKRHQIGGILERFLMNELGYQLSYFGIISLTNSCLKALLCSGNRPSGLVLFISGALSALTASIILFPFRTSTNFKGYEDDVDLGTMYEDVSWMTLGIFVYEMSFGRWNPGLRPGEVYKGSRVTKDLIATLVCTAPEILTELIRGRNAAQQWFLRNSEEMWRGNMVNIVRSLTFCGVNSFAYLNLRSFLPSFTSVALASVAASLVSHPLDTLITHITFEGKKDHNPDATWKTVLANLCQKDGGLSSQLYAGLSASLFGIVPYMTISLVACEGVSLLFERSSSTEETSFMFDLARTSIATLTASAVTFPIEVVRRRMQMKRSTTANNKENVSLLKTFNNVLRNEGVEGLYSGIHSHLFKVVAGHAFAFTAFELLKKK